MIKQYPTHMIDQLWHGGADALTTAAARCGDEWTGDQLKMMLMRGELLLVGSPDLWAAIHHVDHPNKRALHIYAVASRNPAGGGINDDDIMQLCDYARATGCTVLTCSADAAAMRLYQRYGFQPRYTTMGIEL